IVALLTGVGIWMGRTRPARVLALEVQRLLERYGARAGVAWPAGATPNEYGELLGPKNRSHARALHAGDHLVGPVRYSGRPLGGNEESRLRIAAERVWARLARRR